jgi:hypothetical protein
MHAASGRYVIGLGWVFSLCFPNSKFDALKLESWPVADDLDCILRLDGFPKSS